MRPKITLIGLLGIMLVLILSVSALTPLAQDSQPSQPTPTATDFVPDISVPDGSGGNQSNIPSLDNAPVLTTPQPGTGNEQPDAAPTPLGGAPPTAASCPTLVQESWAATQQVCSGVQNGQACLGSGTVSAVPRLDVENFAFELAGQTATYNQLGQLTLRTANTENNLWTVVSARPQFTTTGGASGAAMMLAFGDVVITDTGEAFDPSFRTGTVVATSGMNVRRAPDETGVVVWQLSNREEIIVTGRTADKNWVRMEIPSFFGGIGWVYAPYLEIPGGLDSLPVVTTQSAAPQFDAPDFGPMQAFKFSSTRANPTCFGVPNSGLLVQSPSGTPDRVRMRANTVEIQLNGSAFLMAQPNQSMSINVIEGDARVISGGFNEVVAAGGSVVIPLNGDLEASGAPTVEAYRRGDLQNLPVTLLSRPFNVAAPNDNAIVTGQPAATTQQQTTPQQPAAGQNTTNQAPPQPQPQTQPPADIGCVLSGDYATKNIYAGPGTDYALVDSLQPNEEIPGVGFATDANGRRWYQSTRGWLPASVVRANSNCQNLPLVAAP